MKLDELENPIEASIVKNLVDALLSNGYEISLFDGAQYSVISSITRDTILSAMAVGPIDVLRLHAYDMNKSVHDSVGCIALIYGHDRDVIYDYTASEAIASIVEPIIQKYSI
jgi:hypothetical protein